MLLYSVALRIVCPHPQLMNSVLPIFIIDEELQDYLSMLFFGPLVEHKVKARSMEDSMRVTGDVPV